MTGNEEFTLQDRRKPSRRLVLVAVAVAVVAAAITVPLLLRDRPAPVAPAPVADAARAHPQPPPSNEPAFWTQAMAFQPGRLPDGVVEQSRSGSPGSVIRSWEVPPAPDHWPGPKVTMAVYNVDAVTKTSEVVDVNGARAYVTTNKDFTEVDWAAKPGAYLKVTVYGGRYHEDVALHVARAVRSNGTGRFRPLVDLGWCAPRGFFATTDATDPAKAFGMFRCMPRDEHEVAAVITINPNAKIASGTEVTVRGRQGLYAESKGTKTKTLSVLIDKGRYFVVEAGMEMSRADMIRLADTTVLHDPAYLDWVGKR